MASYEAVAGEVRQQIGSPLPANPRTVFDTLSFDREKVRWEDYLFAPTPVELVRNSDGRECLFKRDDYFAPLGYHGINGSKLRQAIYLFKKYAAGKRRVINGTSVHSPQLPMCSALARHYGLKCTCVLGGTKPATFRRNEMADIAASLGSEFDFINIGYNHNIQLRCQELLKQSSEDAFYLEYGITLDHNRHAPEEIVQFHIVGAEQVKNIPPHITDLVMAAGSCNSCTSVLLGLAHYGTGIQRVHLVGTGPSKIPYLTERLELMGSVLGEELDIYDGLSYALQFPKTRPIQAIFYDLHGEKYCRYEDEMRFDFGGIDLHPTYEGKVMSYIYEKRPELINSNTLFWIVGNRPQKEVILSHV